MQLLVMNEYLAIPFFIVTTIISSIQGGTLATSFLSKIELSANNPNLKCPFLRISKLVKPEPEFLSKCGSFEKASLLTHVTEENLDNALCLLYYNNFLNLCNASNNYPDNTSELDFAVEKVEYKLEEVCESLKNNIYLNELKPEIEVLQKAFDNTKCKRYCTDLDDNVKLVCVYSAYMAESTKKLYAQTPNSSTESKSNKGKKPHLTEAAIKAQAVEHGVDHLPKVEIKENQENPQIQANDANAPVVEQPVVVYNKNVDMLENTNVQNGGSPENEGSVNAQKVEVHKDDLGHIDEQNVPQSSSDHFGLAKQTNEQETPSINKESSVGAVKSQDEAVKEVVGLKSSTSENTNNQQIQNEPPNPADTQAVNEVTSTSNSNNHQNNDKQFTAIVQDQSVQVSLAQDKNQDNAKGSVVGKNKEETNAQQMPAPENTKQQQEEKGKKTQQDNVPKDEGGMDNLQEPNEQMESQDDQDGDIVMGNDVDADDTFNELETKPVGVQTKPVEKSKPREIDEDGSTFAVNYQNQSIDDSESYFFSYFMMVCIMFICGYVAYHNKQKILALVVEGRKGRRSSRTRRPNSANYRKLDSNLEEAVTSSCNKNATQVIY